MRLAGVTITTGPAGAARILSARDGRWCRAGGGRGGHQVTCFVRHGRQQRMAGVTGARASAPISSYGEGRYNRSISGARTPSPRSRAANRSTATLESNSGTIRRALRPCDAAARRHRRLGSQPRPRLSARCAAWHWDSLSSPTISPARGHSALPAILAAGGRSSLPAGRQAVLIRRRSKDGWRDS